ncbi:hypothetical protein EP30_01035 [Bifidobacterium sp. UTCIF-39]|uniref:hypothetical protein n=1 Tax=Bifidobacterium sp. UTCIF-39 TaxID=1465359 RepID=UPI00112AB8C7|nr:hypothetical protein [Bifidobacterium sp. UTCIF-39]TPF97556.1 hypothetical protein EP30_01035 [Bifidobacterium sp. UTCIF-39]
MPVLLANKTIPKPIRNGHPHNAIYNGKILWPSPKDTVTAIRITTIDGATPPTSLPVNGSVQLAATATYGDNHTETLTTEGVTWRSLDTGVATMRGNTLAWAHGGTALVTATVNGFTSAAVSVACAYAPESISVSPNPVIVRVGQSVAVAVSVLPATANQEYAASIQDTGIAELREPTRLTREDD